MRPWLLALCCLACVASTGGALVTFHAAAAGPADATGTLTTDNAFGFHVILTRGVMHVGAVYLNRSMPSAGAQGTACVLPGIYNGEVRGGRDIDVLSPDPQPFPVDGDGTSDPATTGEIWLASGDVNATTDSQVMLDFEGVAEKDGMSFPFSGRITINQNRALAGSDTAQPGAHPICKQRIITPIPVEVTPTQGGTLLVRVDPRPWFANVDFSLVPAGGIFPDSNDNQQSRNLFNGFRAATGAYTFTWQGGSDAIRP